MRSTDLEQKLTAFAEDLMTRAKAPDIDLGEAVKVFREVRELYSILTKDQEPGDKPSGRRSTIGSMRTRIAAAGGAPKNGRAAPTVPNSGG
jgi:hypothetical protein